MNRYKLAALAIAATSTACTTLSPTMQLADALNGQVNREMSYQTDAQQYGQSDRWVVSPVSGKGDCEDYALTKAAKLASARIPHTVQMCILPSGTWHAVVVVDDAGKQWVLDNTRPFAVEKSDFNCKAWVPVNMGTRAIHYGV